MPPIRQPLENAIPLAYRVFRFMRLAGMSPKALSLAAGLNETYVRDLCMGKSRNPKTEQIERLAKVLGCSVNALTQGTNSVTNDKEDGQGLDPSGVGPLDPGEIALVRLWRNLAQPARDQVMLKLTEFLPASAPKR